MSHDLGTVIDSFRAYMSTYGIETSANIYATAKMERFHVDGDKKGTENGWYVLHCDDKANGMFGCFKRYGDEKIKWRYEGNDTKPLSAAELAAAKKRRIERMEQARIKTEQEHESARLAAEEIWAKATPADTHPYLTRKTVGAHALRVGEWWKTNRDTGETWRVSDNALLIPMRDRTGKIHSLQAIFPTKQMSKGTRDKDYLYQGRKTGVFHAIGKLSSHQSKPVFILAEGYATGATIHEATGHMVLVCFDTSNLIHVATDIRERQPTATILIAADNDAFTMTPIENPGVHYARQAAMAVGGLIAIPRFSDLTDKPTDFNDLAALDGVDAVAATIFEAMNGKPLVKGQDSDDAPWTDDAPVADYDGAADAAAAEEMDAPELAPEVLAPALATPKSTDDEPEEKELTGNAYFSILGYDEGNYYLFSHEKMQVLSLTKRDLTDVGLIELAPVNWWEQQFPGSTGGIDKKSAANWLFRTANARGIYDPDRVRGRGAWRDKGRLVFHHGSYLTVDGVKTDITAIRSSYVYPMGKKMPKPAAVPLSDEEGAHLVSVASMARWSMPASAMLLSGWCMLAPVGGVLRWRPHLWITGPAGSGKSTIQSEFCFPLVAGIGIYAQGNSTEPGIRQRLRADAVPVFLDEAESNTERDKMRIQGILSMVRQSSTESQAETMKGTPGGSGMNFHIRSMFCLASINTNLENKADIDRLTRLTIRGGEHTAASDKAWSELEEELHKIRTDEDISARMLARAMAMLPVIVETVDVFRRVAAKHFGSQRDGDQFGTLLAGCWCLQRGDVAEDWEAAKFINSFDWSEHTEDHDQSDSDKALDGLLGAKVRIGTSGEFSVYEVVRASHSLMRRAEGEIATRQDAMDALDRHGLKVDEKLQLLLFGTGSANLKKLVAGTQFSTDLRGQLKRLKGATTYNNKSVRFNGTPSKCVSVPLSTLFDALEEEIEAPKTVYPEGWT